MRLKMRQIVFAVLVAVVLGSGLVRAQGFGNCYEFGAWVQSQGGQVYFIEPSFTPPFAIIGVELYGQGFSVLCIP